MRHDRTARVARTAHDMAHRNRLVVPEYGVVELRLEKGDKSSKSRLMPKAITRRAPSGKGREDFHFAPGPQLDSTTWKEDAAKTDFPTIVYDIYNPVLAVGKATLELFTRFDDTPIWTRDLKGEELLDGEHKLVIDKKEEWNGSINKGTAGFPDDVVTAEHSPYKLKLTVEGKGFCQSPCAWTYFYILLAKIELEYGPKEALPLLVPLARNHRDVLAAVVAQGAAPPKEGKGPIKVFLDSNLFKKGHSMEDNSLFVAYRDRWLEGAEIPIFAKIWVRNSAGKEVLAPRAIGELKFLWDWESRARPTGHTFVDQAQDYDVNATRPDGQNCHVDRGGKRPDTAERVFPKRNGTPQTSLVDGAFPFKVDPVPAAPRTWASYSYAWTKGDLASKTGVIFQPSRMAGDTYRISVYAAYERDKAGAVKLNVNDKAPLKAPKTLVARTGTFQVWRRIQIVQYMKKTAAVTALGFAVPKALFRPAFVELVDSSGAVKTMSAGAWNGRFALAAGAIADPLHQLVVDPAVDQHAAGPAGAYFRSLAGWTAQIAAATGSTLPAAIAALSGAGISTPRDFASLICEGLAMILLKPVFDPEISATEGLNVFQVEGSHDAVMMQPGLLSSGAASGIIAGEAHDFDGGDDRHAGYLHYGPPAAHTGLALTPDVAAAHEIGHHLFLPHPPAVDGVDYFAHDKAPNRCLMGYNLYDPSALCGLCQLRLRGWGKKLGSGGMPNGLDNDGPLNKRP